MACYKPLHGYREKNGKGFTMSPVYGRTSLPMTIPCGYCIGCRLEKSRQWAMRCMHEASLHERNCFITLTFNQEALTKRGTLSVLKRDFQLFIKRLRKKYGKNIRYLHCGEYGTKRGRPHYHALLFGFDFPDKVPWRNNLWRSKELEELWQYGYCSIGKLTFESAAYVARYVVKKRYGAGSEKFYEQLDRTTGEISKLEREYATMSRRPGIGREWYEKYKNDIYPKDNIHVRGKPCRPTRYYDKQLEREDPKAYEKIKRTRKIKQTKKMLDKNQPTLESQEAYANYGYKKNKRDYEEK